MEGPLSKALFQWFIDARTSLKPRLPKSLFLLKFKKFYEHPDTPEEEKLQSSNQWATGWELENRPKMATNKNCYKNQINGIQFLKKTALFECKIT